MTDVCKNEGLTRGKKGKNAPKGDEAGAVVVLLQSLHELEVGLDLAGQLLLSLQVGLEVDAAVAIQHQSRHPIYAVMQQPVVL